MSKPTYEELEAMCRELQDKVARSISLQQELISIKNELDKELTRFQLIQEFDRAGLFQESIYEFGQVAVEYFVQAFEQPKCLIAEYESDGTCLEVIASFGFVEDNLMKRFHFSPHTITGRSAFLLEENEDFQDKLAFLGLEAALVAPLFDAAGQFNGLIICGQTQKDNLFYDPVNPKDRPSFRVMADQTGYLLQNFRANQHLKKEIAERKKVEKQLEQKASDLLHSNAELEQFAYVVSHDLKAPLRNVLGFAKMLGEEHLNQISEEGKEYLGIILRETKRFEKIIDELLKYARVSTSKFQTQKLDFERLIQRVINRISLFLQGKNTEISTVQLPCLPANPSQMEQLFQNLIVNAVKFTPDDRTPVISIVAKPAGAFYRFEVQDNGIGVDPEHQQQIFGLFQRRHSGQADGTGLGLSICKRIVERHNGKIWVESEGIGKGATFIFLLPA